jgi:hypothetical protein
MSSNANRQLMQISAARRPLEVKKGLCSSGMASGVHHKQFGLFDLLSQFFLLRFRRFVFCK